MKKIVVIAILTALLITLGIVKYKENDIVTSIVAKQVELTDNARSAENPENVMAGNSIYDYSRALYINANPRLKNLPVIVSPKSGLTPEYDIETVKPISLQGALQYRPNFERVKVSGRVSIPSISLNLGIFEGINNEHLYLGAAEQLSRNYVRNGGPGNYILASHKISLTKNEGFSFLHNVKENDLIYTTDGINIYTYRVLWNRTLKDNDPSPLNETDSSKSLITLYTCSAFYIESDKIVVRGELIDTRNIDNVSDDELNEIFRK